MKKILAILGLMAVGTFAYSQGIVNINNSAAAFLTQTNSGTLSPWAGGGSVPGGSNGVSSGVAGTYYYALLVQAYTGTLADSPYLATNGNWTFGVTGTNGALAKGSVNAAGGAAGQSIPGWAAPTGASYNTSAEDYFLLVGWSGYNGGNLSAGATTPAGQWAAILAQLESGAFVGPGYLGQSALGFGYAGGGPSLLPATSIWSVTAGMPGGLAGGMTLFAVPEPTTFALLGLGAAGLLIFRRRKE